MPRVEIVIDGNRLEEAARYIVDAMNEAQSDGYTIDEVVSTVLFMAGSGIKQRGAELDFDKPLSSLPPMKAGYDRTKFPMNPSLN